jgi:hypothetical protein
VGSTLNLNPWIVNTFLDSCAFDPKYHPEDQAATELFRLHKENELGIRIAHSTQKEVDHPNTPAWVKRTAASMIYTVPVTLTPGEKGLLRTIHSILTGDGKPENFADDARHIFEAQKYGSYFVTTDGHVLRRARRFEAKCNVTILRPSQFLALVRSHNPVK